MKRMITKCLLLAASFFLFGFASRAQSSTEQAKQNVQPVLKTYLIERDIPGAGSLAPADLKGISQKSCSVLKELGPKIQWIHSYVTGDKLYCVYKAENEELIREHARKGGFPITSITQIATTISPATAE